MDLIEAISDPEAAATALLAAALAVCAAGVAVSGLAVAFCVKELKGWWVARQGTEPPG